MPRVEFEMEKRVHAALLNLSAELGVGVNDLLERSVAIMLRLQDCHGDREYGVDEIREATLDVVNEVSDA